MTIAGIALSKAWLLVFECGEPRFVCGYRCYFNNIPCRSYARSWSASNFFAAQTPLIRIKKSFGALIRLAWSRGVIFGSAGRTVAAAADHKDVGCRPVRCSQLERYGYFMCLLLCPGLTEFNVIPRGEAASPCAAATCPCFPRRCCFCWYNTMVTLCLFVSTCGISTI